MKDVGETIAFMVVVGIAFASGVVNGFDWGKRASRTQWCAARFAQAVTAADSLTIVRDTLPRGCKIE